MLRVVASFAKIAGSKRILEHKIMPPKRAAFVFQKTALCGFLKEAGGAGFEAAGFVFFDNS